MNSKAFSAKAFLLLFCIFILGRTSPVFAVKIELKNGKVYDGEILEQDSSSLILEANGSIINIRKDSLKSAPEGVALPSEPAPAASIAPRQIPSEADEIDRIHGEQTQEQKQTLEKARETASAFDKIKTPPHLEWIKNYGIESAAKNHLRKIQSVMHMYQQENDKWPSGFKELTDKKMLEPEFETGIVGDYKYEIKTTPEEFKVYATPVDSTRKLTSFTLDSKSGKILESSSAS